MGGLVVSGGQPSAMFELREASLDEVAEAVDVAVDDWLDFRFLLAGMTAATPRASRLARMMSASYPFSASRTRGAGPGSSMNGP